MENAQKICRQLFLALSEGPCEGKIRFIDRFEMDVDTPVGLVRLFSEGVLCPFSCLVPPTMNFTLLPVTLGAKVFFGPEEIDINDADVEISLKLAEKVDLSVDAPGLFLPMDLKQRYRCLERAVELSSGKGYFSALLTDPAAAPYEMEKRLRALTEAVKNEDTGAVRAAAAECAGLGEGRYPASDSLLCGYMLAYTAFCGAMRRNKINLKAVTAALLEGAGTNTNRESAFLLWYASCGLADEEGCRLFRCLFSDKAYTGLLASAVSSASRNGCDWLIGICAFIRYFTF